MEPATHDPHHPPSTTTLSIRPRYAECDPMGFVHHSVYPVWFEMARTELLRQTGTSYADLEAAGTYIVVVKLGITYRKPARYDESLELHVELANVSPAKIEHRYEIKRAGVTLVTAETTLACIDRDGKVMRVPDLFYESD